MSKATTISNEVASATIVDVLRLRAEAQRDEIAYRFLADGEEERGTLTYGEYTGERARSRLNCRNSQRRAKELCFLIPRKPTTLLRFSVVCARESSRFPFMRLV